MPIVKDREYRQMALPLATAAAGATKRFDTEEYVEGFATTFNTPYLLYEYDGIQFFEVVDRNALDGADLSDVIMQYDHSGMVFARNKTAKHKPPSLLAESQQSGLFIAADLGLTEEARKLYSTINAGLINKMSWAFRIAEDAFNKETRTRTILRIKKVYDVSAVSCPANADTDISARSWINGAIEAEKREALARQAQIIKLKIKLEILHNENLQKIEARLAAIASEIESSAEKLTAEQLTAFDDEVNGLKTERAGFLTAAEQRTQLLNSIAEGRSGGAVVRSFPSPATPADGEQRLWRL